MEIKETKNANFSQQKHLSVISSITRSYTAKAAMPMLQKSSSTRTNSMPLYASQDMLFEIPTLLCAIAPVLQFAITLNRRKRREKQTSFRTTSLYFPLLHADSGSSMYSYNK